MKRYIFYLLIITILGINSCSTKIELDIPESPEQIAVQGILLPDSLIYVGITKTQPISNNNPFLSVNDASVELWSNGAFIEYLTHWNNGIYKSSVFAQPSANYEIFVNVPGFEMIYASTSIPENVTITSGTIKPDSYYDSQQMDYVSEVEISFNDPPQEKNYYQITFYSYQFKSIMYDYETGGFIVIDSTKTNFTELDYLNSQDPVIINEGDLEFYQDPAGIKSLVFSDDLLKNDSTISFLVGGITCIGCLGQMPVVVLRSISPDYYKFQKSLIRQAYNQGLRNFFIDELFYTINPNDLYTNIENGLGIFSGYSQTEFELIKVE
jgi:hypothetical protein